MPRQPREYKAVHDAADKIEPRLARAVERALAKLRELIPINDLAMRLSARDVRGAMRLLPKEKVEDALKPSATIVKDATMRGVRLGAEKVREV